MLQPSSMLLPWCEQRNEHPLPWHRRDRILAWVAPAPSSATQKGRGVGRSLQCWQRGVKGNSPLSYRAAPCSSDPPVRDLRKENRLLLTTLL